MPILASLTLFLSAGAAPAIPANATPEAVVRALYAPYASSKTHGAVWDWPVYTAETTALIRAWQKVTPQGEVDALSDGDWLCQCQDWDAHGFRVQILTRRVLRPDVVEVRAALRGADGLMRLRLRLRNEGGRWRLDDLFAVNLPRGLRDALRRTIAEDRALAMHRKAHSSRPRQ